MKRRSYLSSRESRSFLHLDLRNGREKFTFIHFSFFRKIRGAEVAETGEGRRVRWSSLDREYRRDTLEISRRIRIIRRRVKQEGDERVVRLVSEIQSMPDRMPLTC